MPEPRSPSWRLRPESADDIEAITAVVDAAFAAAPHSGGNESAIVRALRDDGALTVSWVAELGTALVGQVSVSPVTIPGSDDWYGLGPIAVRPDLQGRGLGSALMHAALKALGRRDAAGCVLVGDPGWYTRFGFRRAVGLDYPGVPGEYLLGLRWRGPPPRGTVGYHPAFSEAG